MLGGGLLALALAHSAGGWLTALLGGNVGMTAHNAQSLLSAVLFSIGALISLGTTKPYQASGRIVTIIIFYGAILVAQAFLVVLSFRELIPPFFVNGFGPTILRQVVVGLSAGLFFWRPYSISSITDG
jgi:hypothetical protein